METINLRINELAIEFFNGNNVKFANAIESSEANIRNYRKNGQPKLDFIVKTCDILKINFEWLLTGKGDKFHNEYLQNEEPLQTTNESKIKFLIDDTNYDLLKQQNELYKKNAELYKEQAELYKEKYENCEKEKKSKSGIK